MWTIALGVAAAIGAFIVVEIGRRTHRVVTKRPFVLIPLAALAVAAAAIAFSEITGYTSNLVLFSGQDAMDQLVSKASTLALGVLALLLLFKALAWGISLGGARGGPTFPAIFIGIVGGLLAAHLPGFSQTPAVGVLVGAMVVSVLRLPLSSIVIALVVSQAGPGVAPLIIVGVVVAYIATQLLAARRPLEVAGTGGA